MKNLFAHAVAEIFLIFCLAQIDKWQNGDAFLRWVKRQHFGDFAAEEPDRGRPQQEDTPRPSPPTSDCDATSARFARAPDRTGDDRATFEPALQISREIAGRLVARFWITFETACANGFQIAIERAHERAKFRRWRFRCLPNYGERIVAQKRWSPGQQIEQNRAETINIGGRSKIGGRRLRPVRVRCNPAFRK